MDVKYLNRKIYMQTNQHRQSGILLIEVMFSILIFSFGLLGLVGLQAVATQNSVGAEDRNTAALLVSDLVSQMYIRKTSRLAIDINSLPGANPTALANDIQTWRNKVSDSSSRLPSATGDVTVNAVTGITTITITWKSPSKPTNSRYETQIVI